ncbi:MAG: DUF4176 domain-containing protein [Butyrivibrio sp.]|nr:DUF4176 domain-containing protein [Butyrivibrio sp.]
MWEGLLPIGSVVQLIGSPRKFLIICTCALKDGEEKKIYDYAACLFPQGYSDYNELYMFDREQIDKIFCVGYMTPECDAWTEQNEKNIRGLRDGSIAF